MPRDTSHAASDTPCATRSTGTCAYGVRHLNPKPQTPNPTIQFYGTAHRRSIAISEEGGEDVRHVAKSFPQRRSL